MSRIDVQTLVLAFEKRIAALDPEYAARVMKTAAVEDKMRKR